MTTKDHLTKDEKDCKKFADKWMASAQKEEKAGHFDIAALNFEHERTFREFEHDLDGAKRAAADRDRCNINTRPIVKHFRASVLGNRCQAQRLFQVAAAVLPAAPSCSSLAQAC